MMDTHRRRFVAHLADASLDVVALLLAYVGMFRGPFKAEPEPENVPDESDGSVEVEGRLPAKVGR